METRQITERELNDVVQDSLAIFKYSRHVSLHVKNVGAGRAHYRTHTITMPQWAWKRGFEFVVYYAIHEAAHFATKAKGGRGHDATFKNVEDLMLANYGLTIQRAKAYPREIYANGERVYVRPGRGL